MDWGSAAEWVGALIGSGVSILSLAVAIQANRQAKDADRRAEESAQELIRRQDILDQRELQRDLLSIGAYLQAWWVRNLGTDNEDDRWGIVISNVGENAVLLSDVCIDYQWLSKRGEQETIEHCNATFAVLPPGVYFKSSSKNRFTRFVSELSSYQPLVDAKSHRVNRISYRTPNQLSWVWTPESGLMENTE